MDLLTIEQARKRLGISDATMRRWLRAGRIKAELIRGKYYFSEQDINRLVSEQKREDAYAVTTQQVEDLKLLVSSLDLELLKLRERVEQLEQRLEHAEKPIAPRTPAERPTTMKERKPHTSMTTEAKGTLPEGLVAFTDFYKAHSISETTARRGLEGQCFPVISGPWHRGNSVIKQALDLSGQRAFCEYFSSKGKLHQCDRADCPCHTIAPQQ